MEYCKWSWVCVVREREREKECVGIFMFSSSNANCSAFLRNRFLGFLIVLVNFPIVSNQWPVFCQFSGHLEEVLDMGLIGNDGSHLVVITNSSKIKVFTRLTMECQILAGHSDTIMAVSTCPKKNLFATASRVSVCALILFLNGM